MAGFALPARPACRRGERRRHAQARATGPKAFGLRALIVVLWRAGLRISEALALSESDLDSSRRAVLVRRGKGGERRGVGMDRWAWEQLQPWQVLRAALPLGALFRVLRGPTRARPSSPAGIRLQMRDAAARAGVRRGFAPHQLRRAQATASRRSHRHAHAVEMSREGVPLVVINANSGTPTSA